MVPPEEALSYRKRLREIGEEAFITETVNAGKISAKKLCTAFGVRPPFFLAGQPDSTYYPLLRIGISRELVKRQKLPQYNTIDDVVTLLRTCKNIIVVTGAGISTSLGIPDFRSPTTGLYAQLERLGLSDPQEVFDISLFREDPSIFYSIAKDILPTTNLFTPTHAFIRLLQDKNKLLTNFTQNIDNIEGCVGILPDKLLQCHGSFATAACLECGQLVPGDAIYADIKAGQVPRCKACIARLHKQIVQRQGTTEASLLKRKRSSKAIKDSNKRSKKYRKEEWEDSSSASEGNVDISDPYASAGVLKPSITFFGEALPSLFHERLVNKDRDLVDLVLVIGTSLQVAPVSEIPGFLPENIPQIYISRESCKHIAFDVELLGECDEVVMELVRRAGWESLDEVAKDAHGKLDGKPRDNTAGKTSVVPKPGGDEWRWEVKSPP